MCIHMTDYSTYTIEAAAAILIMAIAHKIYRMRCDSSSHCCGDNLAVRMHNEGDGQGEYQMSRRRFRSREREATTTPPEQEV
jgi:hypothetical protein